MQGYLNIGPYQIYYRRFGGEQARDWPLLVLHGGPGAPHNYLENLKELASPGREVIFYDQLGSGQSSRPDDLSLWRAERFVEELGQVMDGLGLEKVHLLGQSWGGMLALDFALARPDRLASLILSNTTASMPLWASEAARLRGELPPEVQAVLNRHEAAGTTDSPEYQQATELLYQRHVCRIPYPAFVVEAFEKMNQTVYQTMWGATEFYITGNLKDWERTARLAEIRLPTLIISGEYDESTPAMNRVLQAGIPGSKWVMFENCSHLTHVENPARYFSTVTAFLEELT